MKKQCSSNSSSGQSQGNSSSLSNSGNYPSNLEHALSGLNIREEVRRNGPTPVRLVKRSASTSSNRFVEDGLVGYVRGNDSATRQPLFDEVNSEQVHHIEQEALEELERANMRRVFGEEDDDSIESSPQPSTSHRCQPLPSEATTTKINEQSDYVSPSNFERKRLLELYPNKVRKDEPTTSTEKSLANNLSGRRDMPKNDLIAFVRKPAMNSSRPSRAANAAVSDPLGWQATNTTLKERIAFMYCNDTLADVYFLVGKDSDKQRIPAHKFVLSIGSVVFDAMFNGGLTPQYTQGEILEIELPDVEPSAFLTLLKFLYTDDVSIGPESVMTTLYTAKKYAVPAMESTCVEFLKQSLGADNAFMLLSQARMFDERQLEKLCLDLIDKDTYEALNGEGFTEIDHPTLCLVLKRDTLRIREVLLFQAALRWAHDECLRRELDVTIENKRSVLGEALYLIRFPLMTVEEFAQIAVQSGLLGDSDVINLFLYFVVNPKPDIRYNQSPRCAVAGKELVVSRFQRNEMRWGYSATPDRIKFSVNKKIFVVGFGLFGSIVGPQEYPVIIELVHCGTGNIMAHNDTTFLSDGSSKTFRVLFQEPVEITPCVTYIASAQIKGPDTYYGTKGLRRVMHTSPNGDNTVTFQFTYVAEHNNGTSVEDGQIPEIIFFTQLN